jgi:hypothetical protein
VQEPLTAWLVWFVLMAAWTVLSIGVFLVKANQDSPRPADPPQPRADRKPEVPHYRFRL